MFHDMKDKERNTDEKCILYYSNISINAQIVENDKIVMQIWLIEKKGIMTELVAKTQYFCWLPPYLPRRFAASQPDPLRLTNTNKMEANTDKLGAITTSGCEFFRHS